MDRLRTIPTRQSLELRAEVSTWIIHRISSPLCEVQIKTHCFFLFSRWLPWPPIWRTRDVPCRKGSTKYLNMVSVSELHRLYTSPDRASFGPSIQNKLWIHREMCLWLSKFRLQILTLFVSILNARTDVVTHQNHKLFLPLFWWALLVSGKQMATPPFIYATARKALFHLQFFISCEQFYHSNSEN